ncbi:MAG: hypothetical protein IT348_17790 [Candidatus Eisenbacteria bacterium]|nr:hypothetical protein [Candidatus Eisenbacteria bacterium]
MIAPRVNGLRLRTPRALALAGLSLSGALLALAIGGCGVNDVRVTVVNESGQPLDSLVVMGEGHLKRVKALAAGESARVNVGVNGEDALALRGRMGGRALVRPMASYVEAGYSLRLVVDSSGVVHSEPRAGF